MDKDKDLKPIKEVDLIAELTKDLQTLIAKYNTDMATLNRILSTYEDELSSLKSQFFELSFKVKQMVQIKPTGE